MKNLKYIFVLLIIILFLACNKRRGPKEGELIYKVTYLKSENANIILNLLPKTVTIRFKNNSTVTYVEGFLGAFKLKIISNFKEKESYTALAVMGKKYFSQNHIDSLSAGYEDFKNLTIKKESDDTVLYSGLPCYRANILCEQMGDSVVSILYTNRINIKRPNSNSPYTDIDGVLVKFQTKVAGIDMLFELKKYNKISVNNNEFEKPKGYKKISNKELNEILQSFY